MARAAASPLTTTAPIPVSGEAGVVCQTNFSLTYLWASYHPHGPFTFFMDLPASVLVDILMKTRNTCSLFLAYCFLFGQYGAFRFVGCSLVGGRQLFFPIWELSRLSWTAR